MAQVFDDFQGYALAANPIGAGWTDVEGKHGSSSIIAETTEIGDRLWRFQVAAQNSGGAGQPLTNDAAGTSEDWDLLLLMRRGADNHMTGAIGRYVSDTVHYWGGARNNTVDGRIQRDPNSIAIAAHGLGAPAGVLVWYRFQCRGSALKVKLWTGTYADQPAAWLIEVTDTAATGVGSGGIQTYRSTGGATNLDVAYWAAGTGVDDAPGPVASGVDDNLSQPIALGASFGEVAENEDLLTGALSLSDDWGTEREATDSTSEALSPAGPSLEDEIENDWPDQTITLADAWGESLAGQVSDTVTDGLALSMQTPEVIAAEDSFTAGLALLMQAQEVATAEDTLVGALSLGNPSPGDEVESDWPDQTITLADAWGESVTGQAADSFAAGLTLGSSAQDRLDSRDALTESVSLGSSWLDEIEGAAEDAWTDGLALSSNFANTAATLSDSWSEDLTLELGLAGVAEASDNLAAQELALSDGWGGESSFEIISLPLRFTRTITRTLRF